MAFFQFAQPRNLKPWHGLIFLLKKHLIENKEDVDLIISKNIVSLQKCIEDNHEIVEDKTKKAKIGFEFFKYGLIPSQILPTK